MFAYLLHSPSLLAKIRAKVFPLYEPCTDINLLASRLAEYPQLTVVYPEVLRLATSSVSFRDVQATKIGGKLLRAGNGVLFPYRQMLFDDGVFGEDYADFNPDRFLDDGKLHNSLSFRPFEGGATYYPGRCLAKAKVLPFAALVICRFDLELTSGKAEKASVPIMEICRPCLGIIRLEEGGDVVLKAKPVGY